MSLTTDKHRFTRMKKGWNLVRIGDVCQMKPSKAEARELLNGSDMVSFVPMKNLGVCSKSIVLTDDRKLSEVAGSYTYFADGDVLLAKITPCFENGKLGIASGLTNSIGFGSSEYIVFRCSLNIKPELLFYFLSQDTFRGAGTRVMSGAVGHKRVPKDFIASTEIPLPSLSEQDRIVAILDEAFAAIETATANTKKNLANARELFDSELNRVFSQKGEGWVEKRLGDVANTSLGKMLDKKKNLGELRPYLRNVNVRWFEFDLDDMKQMRILPDEHEKYSAIRGDVLICEGGYPGRAAIWSSDAPVYFQKALHRVRFTNPAYTEWFLYFIHHLDSAGKLKQYFTGAGIQHLTGKVLKQILIPLPPPLKALELSASFRQAKIMVDELTVVGHRKLAALTELKQSILQKAFTGELTADLDKVIKKAIH